MSGDRVTLSRFTGYNNETKKNKDAGITSLIKSMLNLQASEAELS